MAIGSTALILRGLVPVQELFAQALKNAWELEWPIIDPDTSQHFDVSVWEKVQLDCKISQAIEQRLMVVASKSWSLDPASEHADDVKIAEILSMLVKRIGKFYEAKRFLAEAVFRARSYLWMVGERSRLRLSSEIPVADWWLPHRLQHKDKREVRWRPVVSGVGPAQTIRRQREIFSRNVGKWVDISEDQERMLLEVVYRDESARLGYGRGLLEALYFIWWAKQVAMKEGLQAIEKWAQGKLVGKVDSNRVGAAADATTNTVRNQMRTELERLRSRHVAVIDSADSIENVAGGGEGYQIVLDFLQYADDCAMACAMGGVLPFGGGLDKGSLARSKTEADTSEELLQYDFAMIDEPITRKLIPEVFRLNIENFRKMGLGDAALPTFRSRRQKHQSPDKEIIIIQGASQAGVPLKLSQVYERIGYDMPTEDDEVLEPNMGMALGAGGGFGDGANGNGTRGPRPGMAGAGRQ